MRKSNFLRFRAEFEDIPLIKLNKQVCKEEDLNEMFTDLKTKLFGK